MQIVSQGDNLHEVSDPMSPKDTICIKYQILFSRKNKKNISKCLLLKFLSSMQNVNELQICVILLSYNYV